MQNSTYRPDIDGLRAVAVVLVILFHFGLSFSGGFIGVDIFFVISGYLITSIILRQLDQGRFSLKQFWVRRIRRIIPAATGMVVVVLALAWILFLPKPFEGLGASAVAQQLMLSNVYFWKNTDYFAGDAEMMPLLHTWSLAVEEQFYLLYPCLLMSFSRFSQKKRAYGLILLLTLSLVFSIYQVQFSKSAAFYLLPARAWELVLGGVISVVPIKTRSRSKAEAVTLVSMATILGCAFFYDSRIPFPGLAAVPPCVATALIIALNADHNTILCRVLSTRTFVFFGLISYSLYLWHWPVLAFSRYVFGQSLSTSYIAGMLVACSILAILSWRFIEQPFRDHSRGKGNSTRTFVIAVCSVFTISVVGLFIKAGNGIPNRFSTQVLKLTENNNIDSSFESRSSDTTSFPKLGKLSTTPVDLIVWGDSHSLAVAPILNRLCEEENLSGQIIARAGTLPLVGVWRPAENGWEGQLDWSDNALAYILNHRPRHVLLIGRWAVNIEGRENGSLDTLIADSRSPFLPTKKSAASAFQLNLGNTVAKLKEAGIEVAVMAQVPLQKFNPTQRLGFSAKFGLAMPRGVTLAEHQQRQMNVRQILSEQIHIKIIDPTTCFDDQGFSIIQHAGVSCYADDDHLSPFGAECLMSEVLRNYLKTVSNR